MEILNIRISPLILIIIITYLHTVLSRHHIRHYRDRFKRQQGANLFLPDSYVTDTDEPDEGVWSEWSPPSACSRTCGGGVSTQNRQCEPGYTCRGPKFRYISCNTQDCPDLSDFRAQQCSEFDKVPFEGVYYQWVPYTKAPNQCELNCMPIGERFYYRHKQQVVDGTRCNDQSPDVCVDGKCRHVGCDMMLGSPMREDKCRKCGGDGSSCQTITGRYDKQDLQVGYNNIILIPRGATNVNVQETEPSNNYLAVRNTSGHYYLNGNWRIDFPRTKEFAGCAWKYERFPQGFSAPDKISALGPTDEPLIIVLLYQDRNVGVDYEYSVPTLVSPGNDSEIFAWTFDPFNPCSVTCGGGLQYRNVTCVGRQNLNPVEETLCDSNTKPSQVQECNTTPCRAQWVPYPWGKCSAPCGGKGEQLREITCQQINRGVSTIVNDEQCANQPRPPESKPCSRSAICPKWHTGPWKPCDHLCGDGIQTRKVKCFTKNGTRVEILDDSACTDEKPESQKSCNLRPCEGVDWIATEWSGCENKCGLSNETRKVHCASINGKIYPDDLCEPELKPESLRKCKTTNSSCEYLFYASQWSECSAKCGQGIQTRTVFCGVTDGKTVTKVDDNKCDQTKKYELIKNCTVEEKCGGEWFSGPWKECSKKCGGGIRTRKVVCLLNNEVVGPSECDMASIMFAQEDCNTHSCAEGEELTTSMDLLSTTDSISTENPEISTSETEMSSSMSPIETTSELVSTEISTLASSESTEFSTYQTEIPGDTSDSTLESTRAPRISDATDDDYEFIQSDTCDDGEWVDADTLEPVMMGDDPYVFPVPEKVLPEDPSPEDEELMLGDQADADSSKDANVPILNLETGSGDDELTSSPSSSSSFSTSSDDFEGSGFSSTTTDMSSSTSPTTDESEMTTNKNDKTPEPEVGESDLGSEPGTTTIPKEISKSTDEKETGITTEEFTGSTESGMTTDISGSTESEMTSEIGSTVSTTEFTGSTESEGSTESTVEFTGSEETTTEFTGSTESTTEFTGSTESTTEFNGSTESTTEFTGSTESTTEFTGSTESTTEFTGSTESTTEFTGSTESTTEFTGSTESTPEYTGSTETDMWSTTEGTSSITDIFTEKPRMCKRKKKKPCGNTKHGCCPDKITPAKGPFDEGCPIPKTCKESKFGCCDDGVSPALGENMSGCPQSHCNETLFGCCPDNKTPAEGNDNEGCPPPPPACTKSKYGCCSDNLTEAKGPKKKGCEKVTTPKPKEDCRKTTYGCCPDNINTAKGEDFEGCDIFKPNCHESYFRCCPDGVTSARGPNYKGCEMPCSNSTFGCCPDGRTPAHGRRGEGCCLAYEHGCCPDNITPARGPQLEGCSCEYSPYGCCPDNRTAAKGSNKEGCGCGYSEHGCCPDDFTPAKGPNYEGCPCYSFQFGCCPDGETASKGPNQQGCGCRNSEFGCCTDDETPAKGPNREGCDCSASRFGCCLDGVSEARGENYEGCEEIPLNAQENCVLEKERGSCGNYTVKWFFDKDYGGCSRFWYGGCDGNGNRFKSKDECDDVCVKPEGKDRCKLPKISGPCEGYYVQWYYDAEKKYCEQFVYSGCLGNNNRFETVEECNQLCATASATDPCEQPIEEGPCRGNFARWYYEKESKTCRQFRFGGCKGNSNNFATEAACMQKCIRPGVKKEFCDLPKLEGNCTSQEARWYSDPAEKRCKPFYFTGCNGNNNNFLSEDACENECPNKARMDSCHLPAETGNCANYTDRFYYDTKDKACRHFYYGGCGGNENNFYSEQECEQKCVMRIPDITLPPVTPPSTGPFLPEYCLAPSETGPCRAAMPRYYYDKNDGVCKHFIYGGCHGNRNNFENIDDCFRYCGNAQDLCSLPPIVGECKGEYPHYYYDQRTDSCKKFSYGGCGGNYNRFPDLLSCEQRCRRSPPIVPTEPTRRPAPSRPSEAICMEQPDPGNCSGTHAAYFFDSNSGRCTPFTYTGCGGNHNRFQSEEQCERLCGSFAGQDVCEQDKDPGPCNYNYPKYYFNKQSRRCLQFVYGGCGGNGNRFSSGRECESVCLTRSEIPTNEIDPAVCVLPVDKGTCEGGYNKRWYFDNERGECIAFIYSGCGGNFNNFKTFQSCITTCKDYLTQTEPPRGPTDGNYPCRSQFEQCETLRCPHGIEAYVDENNCNNCRCQDPCRQVECPESTKCAIDFNRNRTSNKDPNFVAVCRQTNKEGDCPRLEQDDSNCDRECYSDAECPLDLKCCRTGCGTVCTRPIIREPSPLVTQPVPGPNTDMPYYPAQIDEQEYKPEVTGEIGSHITLRCAVRGNPTPHIAWSKDGLEIDGSKSRYRIKLDQSLQIITLHTTDSGIYLCTADNNLGDPVQNEIKLDVVAPSENRSASVLSDDSVDPQVVVSFNAPAILNCFALGYPLPVTAWWKDDVMLPLKTSHYEQTQDHSLLIHSIELSDLGIYTCQAYNGIGKAASYGVTVKANGPYYGKVEQKDEKFLKYIISPPDAPVTTPKSIIPPTYIPPYVPTPYVPQYPDNTVQPEPTVDLPDRNYVPDDRTPSNFMVPIKVNLTTPEKRFPIDGNVQLTCDFQGYPPPQLSWYKDGVPLTSSNRINIEVHPTGTSRLVIFKATKADSGTYECEAINAYSRGTSSTAITVEGIYIHPSCTDNKFFANCALIVQSKYCNHKYYARFCCKSCTEAGLLPVDGPHLQGLDKYSSLRSNLV